MMGPSHTRPIRRIFGVATLLIAAVATSTFTAPSAGAVTWITVNTTADIVDGDPSTTSLREAIDLANASGDAAEITLAAASSYQLTICGPSEDLNDSGDLDHTDTSQLTIFGNGSTIEQTCAGERVIQHFDAGQAVVLDDLTITGGNVTGTNNDIDGHSIGGGGGVLSLGSIILTDVTVTGNSAEDLGAGIRALYPSAITDSIIDNNTGAGGGAAVGLDNDFNFATGLITVTGSSFDNNAGAGLMAYLGFFTADNSTFNTNGTDGIKLAFAVPTLTSVETSNNLESGIDSIDAAVTFTDSAAISNGLDGIRTTGSGAMTVSNSTISNNGTNGLRYTGCDGLGETDVINVAMSTIEANIGIGIYDEGCGGVTVFETLVTNNAGGIVCIACSEMDIQGSTVTNNLTNGGISMVADTDFQPTASMLVADTVVDGNATSGRGGGINAEGSDGVSLFVNVINATSVTNNSSESDGGGIAVNNGSLTVSGSVSNDNTAGNPDDLLNGPFGEGGGVYVRNGNLTLSTVTVDGNRANGNGGGVAHAAFSGDAATLFNVTLNNNEAKGSGGGLDVDNAASLNIFGAAVTNNQSTAQGGGVAIQNTASTLQQADISGNTSFAVGAGLYAFESINPGYGVELTQSLVANNTGPGAAVFLNTNLPSEILNSTVSGNNTIGVATGFGSNLQLTFATIVDNAGGNITTQNSNLSAVASLVADPAGGSNCVVDGFSISSGYNADTDSTCGFSNINDLPGIGATGLNPLSANGGPTDTHPLAVGSVLRNVVPPATCAAEVFADQRGEPRPAAGLCDVGAYEAQVFVITGLTHDLIFRPKIFRFDVLKSLGVAGFESNPASLQLVRVPDIGPFQVDAKSGEILFGDDKPGRIPRSGPILIGMYELIYSVCDLKDAGYCGTGSLLLQFEDPAEACTIRGTNKRDLLIGTNGDDIICAYGGKDTVFGLGGDDIVLAGSGSDLVLAGSGNDIVLGENGRDVLIGQRGTDWLDGGRGRDRCLAQGGSTLNCERSKRHK